MTPAPAWRARPDASAGSVVVIGPVGRAWDRSTLLVDALVRVGAAVLALGDEQVDVDALLRRPVPVPGPRLLLVTAPHEQAVRHLGTARLHGWLTVLDVDRPWTATPLRGMPGWYHDSFLAHLARHADLVTVVSAGLADFMAAHDGVHPVVIPNACPPLSGQLLSGQLPPAEDGTASRPGPDGEDGPDGALIVGVAVPYWTTGFHWQTLTAAAQGIAAQRPGAHLQVAAAGPPTGVTLPDSVQLLGERTPPDVLTEAPGWRAALVPLRSGSAATCADPVEVYACQALGVPVVATFVPALLDRPGVRVTESMTELVAAVLDPPPEPAAGVLAPAEPVATFDLRATQLLALASGPARAAAAGAGPELLPGVSR